MRASFKVLILVFLFYNGRNLNLYKNVEITGLDEFQRALNNAARALESLHGVITTLNFNSYDPNSVNEAIRQMENAIDNKIASYADNALISGLAQEMKEKFRQEILDKANAEET